MRSQLFHAAGRWTAAALTIASSAGPVAADGRSFATLEDLGGALFADVNLSQNRSQACVSCHSPNLAFTDPRALGEIQGAVSRGDDGHSLGERNAPALTYVALTPRFSNSAANGAVGGFFHDGRAATLEEQAAGPPLNPVEMAMPHKASVVARLKENPSYSSAFTRLFQSWIFDDTDRAYYAMTMALAAFERSAEFATFDSKFDKSLGGTATLTELEDRGRKIFSAKCSTCHLSSPGGTGARDTFSNYRYYNLGVPANDVVRKASGVAADHVDRGLKSNAAAGASAIDGSFKVPSLRNVAVTGPYMHNGVFQDLRTAILFHDRRSDGPRSLNPETTEPWGSAEIVASAPASEGLEAQALSDEEVSAVIAFLRTLTDSRYERLLD